MTGVVGGWDTPPIPLLRPFDLAQGERNTLPLGMERPYFVSRFRGGNDGYARVSWRGMGRATSRSPLRDGDGEWVGRREVGGLLGGPAAVYGHGVAGDEGCGVGAEPDYGLADLFGAAHSAGG